MTWTVGGGCSMPSSGAYIMAMLTVGIKVVV